MVYREASAVIRSILRFVIYAPPLLVGVGVLAGCADRRGGPIAYGPATFGLPDQPKVAALGSGYKIGPLDTLSIKVFKMPDLSGDFEVDLTGQIAFPLIGNVPAAGYTTAELDDQLTQKLAAKYLEKPDVSIGIKASTSHIVTVDGAVNKSGLFPVVGPTTLIQAVAQAGGAAPDANLRRVAVFRQIAGRRNAAAFDLLRIRRGEEEDPQIYAGDIVIVDGSSVKELQRQVFSSIPLLHVFVPF